MIQNHKTKANASIVLHKINKAFTFVLVLFFTFIIGAIFASDTNNLVNLNGDNISKINSADTAFMIAIGIRTGENGPIAL